MAPSLKDYSYGHSVVGEELEAVTVTPEARFDFRRTKDVSASGELRALRGFWEMELQILLRWLDSLRQGLSGRLLLRLGPVAEIERSIFGSVWKREVACITQGFSVRVPSPVCWRPSVSLFKASGYRSWSLAMLVSLVAHFDCNNGLASLQLPDLIWLISISAMLQNS